ncbi:hypothetical protein M8312_08770 [Sphingomonas sp. KRR8]|uniref:hypothetical protein n=1 Tax=Sphingomonas sp. KRR8 TaxID=2942996 RepID=UPI002020ACAD|nr:hypothetical protein [Sphingomonas sp. KRR8]URD59902.1 hypothetical protein M8312_08770 [Sphingomonas sp. KRR8]
MRAVAVLHVLLEKRASPGRLLNAARDALSALDGDVIAVLRGAIAELDDDVARRISELETDIGDLARANGWRLEGIWPVFQVERGIELRVDAAKRIIRVAGEPFDATDSDAITDALRKAIRDLVPKGFSAPDMLEQLRRSHGELRPEGGQVPIFELYGRFVIDVQARRFWKDARADRFVGLSIDQFRARLSRMLEDGATVASDGSELRLLPPLDPKDALFVHQPGEGRFGYVGRIDFVAARR